MIKRLICLLLIFGFLGAGFAQTSPPAMSHIHNGGLGFSAMPLEVNGFKIWTNSVDMEAGISFLPRITFMGDFGIGRSSSDSSNRSVTNVGNVGVGANFQLWERESGARKWDAIASYRVELPTNRYKNLYGLLVRLEGVQAAYLSKGFGRYNQRFGGEITTAKGRLSTGGYAEFKLNRKQDGFRLGHEGTVGATASFALTKSPAISLLGQTWVTRMGKAKMFNPIPQTGGTEAFAALGVSLGITSTFSLQVLGIQPVYDDLGAKVPRHLRGVALGASFHPKRVP